MFCTHGQPMDERLLGFKVEGGGGLRRLPDHGDLAVGLEGDGGEERRVGQVLEHDLGVEQSLPLGEHPRDLADAQLQLPQRVISDHPHRQLLPAPLDNQRHLLQRRRALGWDRGRRERGCIRHGARLLGSTWSEEEEMGEGKKITRLIFLIRKRASKANRDCERLFKSGLCLFSDWAMALGC
jgi:hypothetical protein